MFHISAAILNQQKKPVFVVKKKNLFALFLCKKLTLLKKKTILKNEGLTMLDVTVRAFWMKQNEEKGIKKC